MAVRTGLLLLCALVAAVAGHERCNSGMKGDFAFKTCASFCKASRSTTHCKFCKCQTCSFCGGTSSPSSVGHRASQPAPAAQDPPAVQSPAQAATPTSAAVAAAGGAPAATQPIPASTDGSEGGGWLVPTSLVLTLTLALICYGLAASKPKPKPEDDDDDDDQKLLPSPSASSTTLSAQEAGKAAPAAPSAAAATADAVHKRTLCVLFLCLQYSAYALLRRYATGVIHEGWSFTSVLGIGEAIKFAIAIAMISQRTDASEAPPGKILERTGWLLRNSGKMAVPAVLYLAMNMLGFVSLARVDAGTFAIVQQTKIFFTAFFQRIFLARVLSVPKWCALSTLVCGVIMISIHSNPEYNCFSASAPPKPGTIVSGGPFQYLIGVVAVTLDSALSGFATIYFEKVLKTTVLTIWDRNLQLAFWSMVIYLPWAVYDNPSNPVQGWSMLTVLVALLGAIGGILVAMVIKYADGLAKNLATASSIVLTTAASHFLFGAPMSTSIVVGSVIVIISGYNYQNVQ